MVSSRQVISIIMLVVLLLSIPAVSPTTITTTVSADCEEESNNLQEDLNASNRELALVTKQRDDYAQRLEDSTTILIMVMILLIGSYFIFYLNTRRAKIAFMEYQKRTGINPGNPQQKPRKRRRG